MDLGQVAGAHALQKPPEEDEEAVNLLDTNAVLWVHGGGATPQQLLRDDRWAQDDLAAAAWFEAAVEIGWTRDVFDRLLVAHARFRRWRLATADAHIIGHLARREIFEL